MPENEEAEIPLSLLRCLSVYRAWSCVLHLKAPRPASAGALRGTRLKPSSGE